MPRVEVPPTEVLPKAKRRTFSAAYKARILTEAAACAPGELGALLRREGLYNSHLSKWRAERKAGGAKALAPSKSGPKPRPRPGERERALERELALTRRKLARAELLLTIQKKTADLLSLELLPAPDEES